MQRNESGHRNQEFRRPNHNAQEEESQAQSVCVLPDEQTDNGGGQAGDEDAGKEHTTHLLGDCIILLLIDDALEAADDHT